MNFNLFFTKLLIDSKLLIYIILIMFFTVSLNASPVTNLPVKLTQPDGKIVNCFVSGDEFHFRYHDTDNYTIIQDEKNGYWVYAVKINGKLNSSGLIVGKDIPLNLEKGIDISVEEKKSKRASILNNRNNRSLGVSKGNFNNIGIFIRFADDPEFNESINYYDSLFNTSNRSIKNYFYEESYHKLNLTTYFYPKTEGKIKSYQDKNPRGYYMRYNEASNPKGYKTLEEIIQREEELLNGAIEFIKNALPDDINFDMNNDGKIDNISFIVSGTMFYSELLWPHYSEFTNPIGLKNKRVFGYVMVGNVENREREYFFNIACHEIGHSIGFPDLYGSGEPVGRWDMMSRNVGHSGAWVKHKYAGWIESIPEVEKEGKYTINALQNPENNCYKIKSAMMTDEFIVVEYRKRDSLLEKDIPGDGLLITRINPNVSGNGTGTDEVYYYRPEITGNPNQDIMNAFFSLESGRTKISNTTNPGLVFSDQDTPEIEIYDIGSSKGEFTTFSVKRKNKITASISKTMDSASFGELSISVKYMIQSQGNMWKASIIDGKSWTRIRSDSTGINNGYVDVLYDSNNSDSIRQGVIGIHDETSFNSPIIFIFTQLPEKTIYERESNNTSEESNFITPKKIVSGKISDIFDIDYYSFPAIAGERIEIDYFELGPDRFGGLVFLNKKKEHLNSSYILDGKTVKYFINILETGIYYVYANQKKGLVNFNYFFEIRNSIFICKSPEIRKFSVTGRDKNSVLASINVAIYGYPATLKIEYGVTDKYGNVFSISNSYLEDLTSNDFSASLIERITGLEPGRKYHFRLIVQNDLGTVYSSDYQSETNSEIPYIPEIEPNESKLEANQIYYGDSICGSINPYNDKDYYKFIALANDTIDIYLGDSSVLNKGSIELWSEKSSYPLAYSNQIYENNKSNLKYTITNAGIYYIVVKSYSNNKYSFNYYLTLNKFKLTVPEIIKFSIIASSFNSFQINGTIIKKGMPIYLYLEYGSSNAYGKIFQILDKYPNSESFQFYENLNGFEPNTTYHFRLVAQNRIGTVYSEDITIKTPQKPSGIEILRYESDDYLTDIYFINNQNIICTTMWSGIIRSSDQGKSWEKGDTVIDGLYCLSTPDKINFWAVTFQNIYKSTNSGFNWNLVSKNSYHISSVNYINNSVAYGIINSYENMGNNTILKTTDGGITWNIQKSGINCFIYDIKFIDENKGFAVGSKGYILRTTNGGMDWNEQNQDTNYFLSRIYFIDASIGFIIGSKIIDNSNLIPIDTPVIFKTINGGETWKQIDVSANNLISSIVFYDKKNGVMVGANGAILKSTDSGETWTEQPSGIISPFTDACFLNSNTALIVGGNGIVISANIDFLLFSVSLKGQSSFQLYNNYPNPFNSQTNIEFSLPEDALVKIKIYDILGREMEEILNENKKAGRYGVSWQPKNISTGVYYYRIEAGRYKETKKLLYLK